MVLRIERAAGEHVGAAEEGGGLRTLQHQDFHPAAQEDERGRGFRNHQAVRPARSLSFVAL